MDHSYKEILELLQLIFVLVQSNLLDPALMLLPEVLTVLFNDELVDFILLGGVLKRKAT